MARHVRGSFGTALSGTLLAFLVTGCPDAPPPPPPVAPVAPSPAATPLPEARADGRLPDLARPLHYALALSVDPTKETFTGTTRIDVEVPAPTSHVVLHGRALTVTDARALVTIAGGPNGAVGPIAKEIPAKASLRLGAGATAPEELVLSFASPLPAGRTTLVVTYEAPFDRELSGLYRVRDGERWYAFTQFEATQARRAFPCFDDPSFKVPFDVTIAVPKGLAAFSNTPTVGRDEEGDRTRIRFGTTKPLPTYLVAFAIGELDVVEATRYTQPPIRLIATKGKTNLAALALEATSGIVDELARYLDIPYPYEKLDIVAVPDFAGGAMENAGLITFREERLLLDPARASTAARRAQATIIAHELAHHWFGDLVTAAWWNDLWLNEGMATWMEAKIVDKWRPQIGAGLDALADAHAVMDVDGLAAARAVRQPVRTTNEAREAFDGITYEKGAAVLGTIEKWVGEETFQRGIRDYLRQNAHTSVQSDKLLSALDRASGKDVTTMAAAYLDAPGVPEVSTHLECAGGRWHVELNQEPWRPLGTKKAAAEQVWTIPVCVRAPNDKKSTCADLAMGAPSLVAGKGACPTYVHPNAEASYYRFALDEKELVRLAEGKSLAPGARLSTLSNAWAMVRSGKLPPSALVKVLPLFDEDKSYPVVAQLVAILSGMSETLVEDEARSAFRKFVAARLAKRKQTLGWAPPKADGRDKSGKDETGSEDALLRPVVLAALGNLAADDATLREADEQAKKWLASPASIDADVASVAVELGSRRAGPERLVALRELAKTTKSREERIIALRAMTGFEDKALVEAGLAVALGDEVGPHEVRYVFASAWNRIETRAIAEAWVRAQWDALVKKLPGRLGVGLLRGATVGCSREAAENNAAFYGARIATMDGANRRLAEALEGVSLCAELRTRGGTATTRALLNRK